MMTTLKESFKDEYLKHIKAKMFKQVENINSGWYSVTIHYNKRKWRKIL